MTNSSQLFSKLASSFAQSTQKSPVANNNAQSKASHHNEPHSQPANTRPDHQQRTETTTKPLPKFLKAKPLRHSNQHNDATSVALGGSFNKATMNINFKQSGFNHLRDLCGIHQATAEAREVFNAMFQACVLQMTFNSVNITLLCKRSTIKKEDVEQGFRALFEANPRSIMLMPSHNNKRKAPSEEERQLHAFNKKPRRQLAAHVRQNAESDSENDQAEQSGDEVNESRDAAAQQNTATTHSSDTTPRAH